MNKKMIVAAAVLLMAVSVQAISLDWNAKYFTYTGQTSGGFWGETMGSGSSLWLVYLNGESVGNISAAGGVLSYGTASLLDTTSLAGGNYYGSIEKYDLSVSAGNQLVAVFYDAGSGTYGLSGVQTVVLNDAVPTEALALGFSNDSTFSGDIGGPGMIANVPEPTSFALLALGAAAIGLRRRIRKA
jgi:hypothetical protein